MTSHDWDDHEILTIIDVGEIHDNPNNNRSMECNGEFVGLSIMIIHYPSFHDSMIYDYLGLLLDNSWNKMMWAQTGSSLNGGKRQRTKMPDE